MEITGARPARRGALSGARARGAAGLRCTGGTTSLGGCSGARETSARRTATSSASGATSSTSTPSRTTAPQGSRAARSTWTGSGCAGAPSRRLGSRRTAPICRSRSETGAQRSRSGASGSPTRRSSRGRATYVSRRSAGGRASRSAPRAACLRASPCPECSRARRDAGAPRRGLYSYMLNICGGRAPPREVLVVSSLVFRGLLRRCGGGRVERALDIQEARGYAHVEESEKVHPASARRRSPTRPAEMKCLHASLKVGPSLSGVAKSASAIVSRPPHCWWIKIVSEKRSRQPPPNGTSEATRNVENRN